VHFCFWCHFGQAIHYHWTHKRTLLHSLLQTPSDEAHRQFERPDDLINFLLSLVWPHDLCALNQVIHCHFSQHCTQLWLYYSIIVYPRLLSESGSNYMKHLWHENLLKHWPEWEWINLIESHGPTDRNYYIHKYIISLLKWLMQEIHIHLQTKSN
jgi:hypothetical protein